MSEKLNAIRGTKDLFKDEAKQYNNIVNIAKNIANNYSFDEIITPIFEYTSVFARTMGDTSDVVNKEMYTFKDRNEESITLRPEFTAGIMRAFLTNGLQQFIPLKLFSYGPVFRYERPQKGRQRQFNQLNFEILGSDNILADIEIITIANQLLENLNLTGKYKLEINSLGDSQSRLAYKEKLIEYFTQYKNDLSEDSKLRLEKNPLRILDSKDENDKKIAANAPDMSEYFNDYSKEFFDNILSYLDQLNINYTINNRLVRGLDYYTHSVFEFTTDLLGAQNTLIAGGRYDNLCKVMGGKNISAVGCAAGIERLLALADFSDDAIRPISIIPIGDNAINKAVQLAYDLRKNNFNIDFAYSGNVNKRMKKANSANSSHAIIFGEDELLQSNVKIRNLDSGNEESVGLSNVKDYLQNLKSSL